MVQEVQEPQGEEVHGQTGDNPQATEAIPEVEEWAGETEVVQEVQEVEVEEINSRFQFQFQYSQGYGIELKDHTPESHGTRSYILAT